MNEKDFWEILKGLRDGKGEVIKKSLLPWRGAIRIWNWQDKNDLERRLREEQKRRTILAEERILLRMKEDDRLKEESFSLTVEAGVFFEYQNDLWWGLPPDDKERRFELYHYCWSETLKEPVKIGIERELTMGQLSKASLGLGH